MKGRTPSPTTSASRLQLKNNMIIYKEVRKVKAPRRTKANTDRGKKHADKKTFALICSIMHGLRMQ